MHNRAHFLPVLKSMWQKILINLGIFLFCFAFLGHLRTSLHYRLLVQSKAEVFHIFSYCLVYMKPRETNKCLTLSSGKICQRAVEFNDCLVLLGKAGLLSVSTY